VRRYGSKNCENHQEQEAAPTYRHSDASTTHETAEEGVRRSGSGGKGWKGGLLWHFNPLRPVPPPATVRRELTTWMVRLRESGRGDRLIHRRVISFGVLVLPVGLSHDPRRRACLLMTALKFDDTKVSRRFVSSVAELGDAKVRCRDRPEAEFPLDHKSIATGLGRCRLDSRWSCPSCSPLGPPLH